MISDFPTNPNHFVTRNIRRYANKSRSGLESNAPSRLGIEGVSLLLKNRDVQFPKNSARDINANKIYHYFQRGLNAKQAAPSPSKSIKYQGTYTNCIFSNADDSSNTNNNNNNNNKTAKKISGVRRTSIKSKAVGLSDTSDIKNNPPKIDETNDIIFRNLLTCGDHKKITYYTYREVFPVPVKTLPNDIYYQLKEQPRNCQLPPRNSIKKINRKKLKIILPQTEAISEHNRFKTVKEIERLRKERMEGKTEKSRGGERSNLTPGKTSIDNNSSNSLTDNHQFPPVNDKDKDYSDFIDDKRRICSNIECKSFVGEATRNRKLPKDLQLDNPELTENETSEEYLQDSYNYVFQRHVDNLNSVISQHMVAAPPEKPKTHVHIHPTENFCKETTTTADQSALPKSPKKVDPKKKKKIVKKIKRGDQASELKSVTFPNDEEDDDDGEEEEEEESDMTSVITEKLEEANLFEELNNNDCSDQKPVIIFNHVLSETKPEQVSFEVINKRASRSPSPLLEVPPVKELLDKEEMRPPL